MSSKKRKKHKYKVVTPPPTCVERQESVFSVTGFLTFVVVSATAVSNVISNIDNNNNNNNNNDNNDNVNNNNQISDSDDATNMGNARRRRRSASLGLGSISSSLCLPYLLCRAVQDTRQQNLSPVGQVSAMVSIVNKLDGVVPLITGHPCATTTS